MTRTTDEIRTINGVTYATLEGSARRLVRKARYDSDCDLYDHEGDKHDAIARGSVYVEELGAGSYNSGARVCLECAVRREMVIVGFVGAQR